MFKGVLVCILAQAVEALQFWNNEVHLSATYWWGEVHVVYKQLQVGFYDYETFGDIAESFLAMGFGVVYLPPKSHLFPMPIHTAAQVLWCTWHGVAT